MRINKKEKKENNYNEEEAGKESERKNWPQDRPIKTFRPGESTGATERTKEEERYNIDTGLS